MIVGAGNPVHVPLVDVSVEPTAVLPDITGSDALTGALGGGVGVMELLIATTEPLVLVPVTRHATASPMSAVWVA